MEKPKDIREFSFDERLAFSHGHAANETGVFEFLRYRIPNYKGIVTAAPADDRSGCDYYIERHGPPGGRLASIGIDLKRRSMDYSQQSPPSDDLALESFSVIEQGIVGWTRNGSKATDYVLWYWEDTGRFFLALFPGSISAVMPRLSVLLEALANTVRE